MAHLAKRYDNVHLAVCGHRLDLLCKQAVTTQRMSREGVMIERTTSLYDEMKRIASGEQGVCRMWTYPPLASERDAEETTTTIGRYAGMTVPGTGTDGEGVGDAAGDDAAADDDDDAAARVVAVAIEGSG